MFCTVCSTQLDVWNLYELRENCVFNFILCYFHASFPLLTIHSIVTEIFQSEQRGGLLFPSLELCCGCGLKKLTIRYCFPVTWIYAKGEQPFLITPMRQWKQTPAGLKVVLYLKSIFFCRKHSPPVVLKDGYNRFAVYSIMKNKRCGQGEFMSVSFDSHSEFSRCENDQNQTTPAAAFLVLFAKI